MKILKLLYLLEINSPSTKLNVDPQYIACFLLFSHKNVPNIFLFSGNFLTTTSSISNHVPPYLYNKTNLIISDNSGLDRLFKILKSILMVYL